MTTPWKMQPIWHGETVAVLASGPSMNQGIADQLRQHRCIVVNHMHHMAPWADMMVALDLNMALWDAAKGFAGMRVCGVSSDKVDALYAGPMCERVVMSPHHTIEIHNSGLAAIRIAAAMGAARIVLAGFDPHLAPAGKYEGLAQALAAMLVEYRARGIVLEQFVPMDVGAGLARTTDKVTKSPRRRGSKAAHV